MTPTSIGWMLLADSLAVCIMMYEYLMFHNSQHLALLARRYL